MTDEEKKPKDEPKIIVDEDWKAQAQAEKEGLAEKAAEQAGKEATKDAGTEQAGAEQAGAEQAGAEKAGAEKAADAGAAVGDFPEIPADLSTLISSLATQAMMALGQFPNPISGKNEVNLPFAQHMIDTLAMLQEKTEGNRTAEESTLLANALHQLRMGFVYVKQQPPAAAEETPPEEKA